MQIYGSQIPIQSKNLKNNTAKPLSTTNKYKLLDNKWLQEDSSDKTHKSTVDGNKLHHKARKSISEINPL